MMMTKLSFMAALCADSLATELGPSGFAAFVQLHGRDYEEGTVEYQQRHALFERRLEEVQRLNQREDRLWEAGINHLSDWTEGELTALRGWRGHASSRSQSSMSFLQTKSSGALNLPKNHMWNTSAALTAENQGMCGSCWAVAAAKLAEANHAIQTGKARSFSAQQFVDCVPNPQACGGTGGCEGATVELAMLYMSHEGLGDVDETPYLGKDSACKAPAGGSFLQASTKIFDRTLGTTYGMTMDQLREPGIKRVASTPNVQAINFMNWERMPENEYEPVMKALMEGVVAVSVAADSWAHYQNGIFDMCGRDAVIDHAVVATGFGVDKVRKQKFWKILNSWGSQWGEEGSIRLLRTDADGQYCGMDNKPEEGTACKGETKQVKVCGPCGLLYDTVTARFAP